MNLLAIPKFHLSIKWIIRDKVVLPRAIRYYPLNWFHSMAQVLNCDSNIDTPDQKILFSPRLTSHRMLNLRHADRNIQFNSTPFFFSLQLLSVTHNTNSVESNYLQSWQSWEHKQTWLWLSTTVIWENTETLQQAK